MSRNDTAAPDLDAPEPATGAAPRTRRRRLLWIGAVVGVVILAVVLALTQPWVALIDRRVDEAAPAGAESTSAAPGDFVSIAHGTTGTARIVTAPDGTRVLRLESLDTDNGPDLKVWLSAQPVDAADDALDASYVALGDLKANTGNQNYPIPADADLSEIRSVVIWCERFRVAFGAAPLAAPADGATAAGAAGSGRLPGAAVVPVRGGTTTITTRRVGSFGRVLVDGRGLPLYLFTRDSANRSRCSGACADAWPVTRAKATLRAAGAVDPALLTTITRKDGSTQVAYAGHPLYTYVDDRPGVALCHDVVEFGGRWLLVRASGDPAP